MKFDLFADGIANVSIAAGVVRIDFYIARPPGGPAASDGAAGAEREIRLSVNLPLPTFVSSMNVLQQVMSQLIERGVVSGGRPPGQVSPPVS